MIATVTFDAGQTLIELDPTMLAARLAERGVAATPAALTAAQPAAWELYDRAVRAGGHERPWQVFMAALVAAATGVDDAHADALAGWLWSEQPRRNLWRQPVPGMIELARALAEAGVTVAPTSTARGPPAGARSGSGRPPSRPGPGPMTAWRSRPTPRRCARC